jgi:RNA polymerase sigma-70 factor (ECF subfamily)
VAREQPRLDPPGFESWYRENYQSLAASMLVVTRDASLAADITDEAFVRALERWERVGAMASPTGWTYRVAVNLAKRQGRRRGLERAAFEHVHGLSVGAFRDASERSVEVWNAVADLPPRMRTAIALRYVADLTEADTAAGMGVRPGTVARLLHDARRRLASALHEDTTEATR